MSEQVQQMPLSGVRVLDAATFLAGPFCATVLSEFGAEVVKIEHPRHGDPLRGLGRRVDSGETLTWLSEARNKKAITLDLSKPQGAKIFKEMAQQSDVVIENFRPGTMERWGLSYEELAALNPGLVMVRISAYGQDGPYKNRPGFARIAQAFSGLAYLAGEPDGPPVVPGSTSLADYISGLYGAIGALIALRHRDNTGQGQYVDMALYESTFRLLDELAPAYAKFGQIRERMGADVTTIVPHSHYQCADGEWVALACSSDKMFERLAHAMKRPDLVAPGAYATMQSRLDNRGLINRVVGEWIGQHSREDLMRICLETGVPCGPINSIADIFADEQIQARGNLLSVEDEEAGEVVVPSVIPRLSHTPGRVNHLGRHKGADNEEVYRLFLGYSRVNLQELKAKGVI